MSEKGYAAIDGHGETFLTNMMSGDYVRMKTEVTVPVEKVARHVD